ncbi:peroxisome biogenesis factor 1-like [Lingula anatina]|uniref:Peroxisome biogenesis factor 1-like n=1 Tax=Lingula anatina TaxID=7574 RepID=A0A1S3HS83_LINAN|nr:peroxisome biogenesis factor 1-like [Lingula anatina]|eukprot:XP_013388893.1 peroxisome biogenesis factor 1-like [Lingula anatina]
MQDPAGQCWAAVIRGGRNKNCFVSLPSASWTSQNTYEDGKLQVFQLQSQSGRIAYVSWSGGLTTGTPGSQDTIELNGLYADKLGFKVGEEVLVKAVPSVASCTRIFVEPLSVDDWEILELHSSFLESHLLNQLRVVWPQQVMPLWVEGAVCIFVTVASMEPNVPCALLEQHTEVVIAPKVRQSGSRSSTFKPKAKVDDKLNKKENQKASANEEHSKVTKMKNGAIVNDVKTSSEVQKRSNEVSESKLAQASYMRGMFDFCRFILMGPQVPLGVEMSSDLNQATRSEILDTDVNMVLRVQPMKCLDTLELMSENGGHDLSSQSPETTFLLQPTTVYISANTLLQHGYVDIDAMCPSFLAKLTKLPSPKEKREIAKRAAAKTKTDKNLKDKAKGQPGHHDNKVKAEQGQSIVVRVVVVNAQYVVPSRAKTPTENEIVMKGNIYAKKKVTFGEETDNIFEGDEKLGSGGEFHSGGRVHSETGIPGGGRVHCGAGVEVSRTKVLETVSDGHILLPEFLRRQRGLGAFTRVHLEGIHSKGSTFTQLSLHPLTPVTKKYTKEMYRTALRVWLRQAATENFPFIITQGTLFSLPLGGEHSQEFLLTLQGVEESPDSTETYAQLEESSLDAVRVRVTEQVRDSKKPREVAALPASSVAEVDCPVPAVEVEDLGGIKSLSQQAIEFLECSIAQRPLPKQLLDGSSSIANGCLLVCGNKGCGKSSFTRGLCAKLSQPPNLAYVEIVDCKSLKGKRIEVIQTILRQVFNEAAWRQPAVILLDDLDHVTSSPRSPEMELTGEAMYNAEVAEGEETSGSLLGLGLL